MDAIAQARRLIEARLKELDRERDQLNAAMSSLDAKDSSSMPRSSRTASRPARARGSRRGKRAPRGQRQEQFLAAISTQPGASMSEIARQMGVKPQQLYPIARKLTEKGLIAKHDGGGYAANGKKALERPPA